MRNVNARFGASGKTRALLRSKQLLLDHLTDEEKKSLEKDGTISVEFGREVLVIAAHDQWTPNVISNETGKGYCLAAEVDGLPAPHYDMILAQYLLLKYDPFKFFERANQTGYCTFRTERPTLRQPLVIGFSWSG